MSRRSLWFSRGAAAMFALQALLLSMSVARAAPVTAEGRRLAFVLDSLEVERRWLPGDGVNWRTGEHDPAAKPLGGHCSAFVAAACAALHVYILRPPEHEERLLANAQCAWLQQVGSTQGWTRTEDAATAQSLADQGNVVLACYRNRDRSDPGHIAVVRPSDKPTAAIQTDGPDVTSAGTRNYRRTSARVAFVHHARAWSRGEIVYYWHPVP